MAQAHAKLSRTPPRSPERDALAAAIARRAAAVRALADADARLSRAEALISERRAAVERAETVIAAAKAARARGVFSGDYRYEDETVELPASMGTALAALAEARDALAAAEAEGEGLPQWRSEIASELFWSERAIPDLVRAVVKSEAAARRVVDEYLAARACFLELAPLMRFLDRSGSLPDAGDRWNVNVNLDSPLADTNPWPAAIQALASDPDSLLPGDAPRAA